jgi:hypothetical protein
VAKKFVRGLQYTNPSTVHENAIVFKLLYEFWCFCVNGGSSVTTPGGLASTTPTSFAANFADPHSGGTVLLASGTDGVTTLGFASFTAASAPFTSSMVGKYLVTWKPASGSSEDSIYLITGYTSASVITVNVNNGGTPGGGTLYPSFTTRGSINYRVIDAVQASQVAGLAAGQYMVLQTSPSSVNTGQASSQAQFFLRNASFTQAGVVLSPGGTWSGSAFTDGTTEQQVTWFNGQSAGSIGVLTMIGDVDGILLHDRTTSSETSSGGSGLHLEVPTRLYAQAQDTNPIAIMLFGNEGMDTTSTTNRYGGGFWMMCPDQTVRKHRTICRALMGDGYPGFVFGQNMTTPQLGFNTFKNTVLTSDIFVCNVGVIGQYTYARARLRYARLASAAIPSYHRIGNSGEWLHLTNGICWPWDNTILPMNLMQNGF